MRIGFASDIHQLVPDRKLIIAGVVIPFDKGEKAHSDGDVVYHALAESILGALALGDLGKYFLDNDEKFLNIDSSIIVKEVYQMMSVRGYQINNVDISITLEEPKLKDRIIEMRSNIAKLLNTDINNVSVKAGTNEKLGPLGKGEAVKAESIVMLIEK